MSCVNVCNAVMCYFTVCGNFFQRQWTKVAGNMSNQGLPEHYFRSEPPGGEEGGSDDLSDSGLSMPGSGLSIPGSGLSIPESGLSMPEHELSLEYGQLDSTQEISTGNQSLATRFYNLQVANGEPKIKYRIAANYLLLFTD